MRISVNIPSYKRPFVESLKYVPSAKVWVDEGEYDSYVEQNRDAEIIACPAGVQGNLCRVRNYILDTEFGNGYDVVLIIDDDLKELFYYEAGHNRYRLESSDFVPFLEKYSLVCMDWGAHFWGVNNTTDKKAYREYTPFSTLSYICGPFQCFVNDGGLRYDEKLPLKEDYDMTLQQIHKHGRVFRVNKYFLSVRQSEQAGGCATYRNIKREKEQFDLLVKKWGSKVVRRDKIGKGHAGFDYNPVIAVPIKGV